MRLLDRLRADWTLVVLVLVSTFTAGAYGGWTLAMFMTWGS